MNGVVTPIIRRPAAVYRGIDPVQGVLRKELEVLSDADLTELERDIAVDAEFGVTSTSLCQMMAAISELIEALSATKPSAA